MLTIKSGKKGPQIKKGMMEAINRLIKIVLEYLRICIKIIQQISINIIIIYFKK